jgi:hypothetical protein
VQRIIDIVSVLGGVLGTTAIPVVLALLNRRHKAEAHVEAVTPVATFGLGLTVETAVQRGDRIANDYLLDLRTQRDDAKADAKMAQRSVDSLEDRLDDANDKLRSLGEQPY